MTGTPRPGLRLRIDPALRYLLRSRHRSGEVTVPMDGTSTLGHVVQSLGIPLTEVGELRADGAPVPPGHVPAPGEVPEEGRRAAPAGPVVDVLPVRRPQPPPVTPLRFLLDVHLGGLARRLRLLGLDTAYYTDRTDEALLQQANAERRVLLTQDRGLLRRRALWAGAHVRGAGTGEQLTDVLTRFAPPLAPWTRCPACNGELAPVRKEEIAHLLRPGTRRSYDTFLRCGGCARVYWRGAHHGSLEATVAAARELLAGRRPPPGPKRPPR
ncbi:Mut7-C RNAse domain-containing protein [Streptomyces sp. YIM 98790]|uniref:Mut7-C RNAse domain-containing protein n=1 Tax=Streptomyces sp. YIM 98790 TaxID=2689077 RepID=UPI0028BEC468|nr:Mut7-C RNAse domain-containing protein [Streptomyces sp. YIM 98790]